MPQDLVLIIKAPTVGNVGVGCRAMGRGFGRTAENIPQRISPTETIHYAVSAGFLQGFILDSM